MKGTFFQDICGQLEDRKRTTFLKAKFDRLHNETRLLVLFLDNIITSV